jgi:uncharacterized protein YcsI (UPF0317 family)
MAHPLAAAASTPDLCYVSADSAVADLAPAEMRRRIRAGRWREPTPACCRGFVQANLVVLPQSDAGDFLMFCQRNPLPGPLLAVTEPGAVNPRAVATGADLRTDVPRYRVHRSGTTSEVPSLQDSWRDDLVSFLLGCSFTFDAALERAGIPVRHIEQQRNVPMYVTSRRCEPAGRFAGPLVVSMRPIPARLVKATVDLTERLPLAHGAPVHVGDPAALGIGALERPDYGNAVALERDDVPVFWACGVTPQAVARAAHLGLMMTHAPGHMFITDLRLSDESLVMASP